MHKNYFICIKRRDDYAEEVDFLHKNDYTYMQKGAEDNAQV